MSFGPEVLLSRLDAFAPVAGEPTRFIVAFSGGLDSSVLLHALAAARDRHGRPMSAVHVNHGLHPDARSWAAHCERVSASLGIGFSAVDVEVDLHAGDGPEAAARAARYAALGPLVGDSEWLMSAHHRDDQAETLLINLLRGSGPAGAAGIPAIRRFAGGWLVRPLLDVPREALVDYADRHSIEWIDDPSNEMSDVDRNFLRNEVLPVLRRRWPDASGRLARSARHAREATGLLADLADGDIQAMGGRPERLDAAVMATLAPARARNALRRAIARSGLPAVPAGRLGAIVADLVPARADATPLVTWPGAEARRYAGHVYLLAPLPDADFDGRPLAAAGTELGQGLGRLELVAAGTDGLSRDRVAAGLVLRARRGGEEIKIKDQQHTRKLKKLLHEANIVPWMRDRLPLVYSDDELVAVADLWLAQDALAADGFRIRWHDRPPLY